MGQGLDSQVSFYVRYSQYSFKETNKGGPAVSGIWWYDANTIRMRTDRVTGKYDEMHCGNEDTHCVVLTDNKFAWV
jgi:hypothetical protein